MAYDKSTSERRPSLDVVMNRLFQLSESENIAVDMDETELRDLGHAVLEEYKIDRNSRQEWEDTAKRSMEIALQVKSEKNFPFPKASNIKWPLITVAALQFNARAYPAIVDDAGIVKGKVIGQDPDGLKREKADRIGEHMSYQLKEEMDGWEEDTDTLLIQLPIVGDVVKKVYHDGEKNCSELIPAIDFVVHQRTKGNLKNCPRMTHVFKLYPHEIEERIADGRYIEFDFEKWGTAQNDNQAPQEFLEQHRRVDLDKDGYREPYIVTLHKESQTVVAVVANYRREDVKANDKRILKITPADYFVNFVFIPDPKGGFYGIGFGSLLENISSAIDSTVNQMIDAATLQNSGGGFIGSGLRLKKGYIERQLGRWINIDAPGQKIRDAMVPFEDRGPSQVSFVLLELLLSAASDITATKDVLTGETGTKGVVQPTTLLAQIEQGLKVFTAIYKRIYRSLRQEFRLLFRLNAEHLDENAYFNVLDTEKAIARQDYDVAAYDVCPVADPRLVTDMQRLARAQALIATYQINPNPEILRRYYVALGIEDVDAVMPQAPDPAMAQMQGRAAEAEVGKTESEAAKNQAEAAAKIAGISQEDAALGLEMRGQEMMARKEAA